MTEETMNFSLPLCAYEDAGKAIAKLIKEKIGKPKYRLERRTPETRDFSESPTSFGVTETWELTDTFGSFLDGPNGETHATYISGFGLAADTHEDDLYKVLDDEIGGAFFGKYPEYWDDMEKFYDSGEAQDFVSEQKLDFLAQVKRDYEGDTLRETIKALETNQ
jgi:hypothetical protein